MNSTDKIPGTVCVLMSTYNGEKFLREQIDSVNRQMDVTVKLLVRDDGSIDSTPDILKYYERKGYLEILDLGENMGPAVSFMELLYKAPSDYGYYAFADQDDIWDSYKLKAAITAMRDQDDSLPLLYCSNQRIYQDGEEKELRFKSEPNHTLTGTVCGNSLSGCTMVMNNLLRDIIINPCHRPSREILKIRMHDVWVLLVAEVCGKVIYDPAAYIDYRIHDGNTVGIKRDGICQKLKRFFERALDAQKRNGRSKIAKEIVDKFDLSEDNMKILQAFANYRSDHDRKLFLITSETIKRDLSENRLVFILKVLANWI